MLVLMARTWDSCSARRMRRIASTRFSLQLISLRLLGLVTARGASVDAAIVAQPEPFREPQPFDLAGAGIN